MSLAGRHVVILGGTSGIGAAAARQALAEGARVTVTGRSAEKAKKAADALGAEWAAFDVGDAAAMEAFFAGQERVDHVVLLGGGLDVGLVREKTAEAFRGSVESRLYGAYNTVHHAVKKMPQDGSVVFISGIYSVKTPPGGAMLAATIAGVETLGRALAREVAPIRVNTLRAGVIDTPLLDAAYGEQKAGAVQAAAERLPAGRIGTADEAADAILFLLKSGFVTGTTLDVNGGELLV